MNPNPQPLHPQKALRLPFPGMAVKLSPHAPNTLALGCSENFGIVGASAVVIDTPAQGQFTVNMPNSCTDICWSEALPDTVIAAGGDGSVRVAKV